MNGDYNYLKNCPHVAGMSSSYEERSGGVLVSQKGYNESQLVTAWECTYREAKMLHVLHCEHFSLHEGCLMVMTTTLLNRAIGGWTKAYKSTREKFQLLALTIYCGTSFNAGV
jgi:hypothetical protein